MRLDYIKCKLDLSRLIETFDDRDVVGLKNNIAEKGKTLSDLFSAEVRKQNASTYLKK